MKNLLKTLLLTVGVFSAFSAFAEESFVLPEKIACSVPAETTSCGTYAKTELVRLLAKLGTKAEVKEGGKTLAITLGKVEKVSDETLAKVRGNGFVSSVSKDGITLEAKTEKGLLNAVYTLAEELGMTYAMPGEKNEIASRDAPRALPCGTFVRNTRSEHSGVICEVGTVTRKEDYSGDEWMAYFAKLRFDMVLRHARGHISNDPKYGFIYGDGAHGFDHLLPREFKDAHMETSRQERPDDFRGKRVNDVNFCPASETAWKEIEKNFKSYANQYKSLDHLTLELADLPGGGHCFCANCRSYNASDLQAIVMNRFAEIAEKLGLKCTIQMNAYHDTMMPSRIFPPRSNIQVHFCPRERCFGHAFNDTNCARNAFYNKCLESWKLDAFPYAERNCYVGYYNDQILCRGMYPFIPDVITEDLKYMIERGFDTFLTLQVGGQIFQTDYNLLYLSQIQWDETLDKEKFCKDVSERLAGKNAPALEKYLLKRAVIFEDALKWCDTDVNVCHLDYRWLKEDDSEFSKRFVTRLHDDAVAMKKAADELKKASKVLDGKDAKLFSDEAARAEFEAEIMETMSRQQEVGILMTEARRTRDAETVRKCKKKFEALSELLRKSIETGDKAGIGYDAYYGRFVDPWLLSDVEKKIEWCDSVLQDAGKQTK